MMEQRLIDANALIEATKNFCDGYKVHWTDNKVLAWIDHAPTVDAVPVVRCKDCKHCQYDEMFGDRWCNGSRVHADSFCSDGERRDSDG